MAKATPRTRKVTATGATSADGPPVASERPTLPPEPQTVIVVPKTVQETVVVHSRTLHGAAMGAPRPEE